MSELMLNSENFHKEIKEFVGIFFKFDFRFQPVIVIFKVQLRFNQGPELFFQGIDDQGRDRREPGAALASGYPENITAGPAKG